MKSISVKNFRSIEDSGKIELKPLTVAVGKNSAGKSSFIRIFPLLKQTMEMKTAEPLLWYGDYVDFGDFLHTVNARNKNKPIVLSFTLEMSRDKYRRYLYRRFEQIDEIDIELSISEKRMEKIVIQFANQNIIINNSDKEVKIIINGQEGLFDGHTLMMYKSNRSVIPEVIEQKIEYNQHILVRLNNNDIERKLIDKIYKKEDRYGFKTEIQMMTLGDDEHILSELRNINKEKYGKYRTSWKRFQELRNMIISYFLSDIIDGINSRMMDEMSCTNYLKPIRAMVDRYYRVQGISIDELNADGSNLPMILKNMSKTQLVDFEKWCKDKFGVVFSVKEFEGHISLVIKSDVNGEVLANVADTGYGYSQILPIIMILWRISKNSNGYVFNQKTIVIEQPELHLHPAYQTKLIDVFANIIKEAEKKHIDLKIIIETHSESMINEIGYVVAKKLLKPQDVKLLLFDKDSNGTIISEKDFNEDGLLELWPAGFFAAER